MYDRNPSNLRPRVSNVLKQNKTHMASAQQEIMQEWGGRQAEMRKAHLTAAIIACRTGANPLPRRGLTNYHKRQARTAATLFSLTLDTLKVGRSK